MSQFKSSTTVCILPVAYSQIPPPLMPRREGYLETESPHTTMTAQSYFLIRHNEKRHFFNGRFEKRYVEMILRYISRCYVVGQFVKQRLQSLCLVMNQRHILFQSDHLCESRE